MLRRLPSPFAARARYATTLLLLAGGAIAMNATAQDSPPELKLSIAQSAAFPLGKAGERWAQLVNDKAGGAFEIKPYPGAVLAGRDPQREFGALRDGAADMSVGSALAWSAQLPSFAVYALPWIAPETGAQEVLAGNVSLRERIAARAALAGVVVLAIAPLGDRVLSTAKAAMRTPAELTGLRLRVAANPLLIETLALLGARPSSMPFADAQAAFADGTLDGQEAPASTLAATRIASAGQKFVTRWGAFSDVMVFAVRRAVWDGWSESQREYVRAAAADAAREAGALAREDAALAELTRQGVTLVRLTTAQQAAFRSAVQPVWTKWAAPIGAEILAAAKAAVAAAAAPAAVAAPAVVAAPASATPPAAVDAPAAVPAGT